LRAPWFAVFDDGLNDSEELALGGGQGRLGRFAGGTQAQVKGFKCWIEAHSDEGAHLQRGANLAAASAAHPPAAQRSNVAIEYWLVMLSTMSPRRSKRCLLDRQSLGHHESDLTECAMLIRQRTS